MLTKKFVLIVAVLLLLVTGTQGQQAPSGSCDIPVVATHFDSNSRSVSLVKGLTRDNFHVRLADSEVKLENVSVDDGPKRVAVLLDASGQVTEEEWKLETEMAAALVGRGRTNDRFTFAFIGASDGAEGLQPPKDALEFVKRLSAHRPSTGSKDHRLYDCILAASEKLVPPQFGDAIFLFGEVADSGSKSTPEQLRKVLLESRLRFYGLSFSDPLQGRVPAGWTPNEPVPASFQPPPVDGLCAVTGYFMSYHQLEVLRRFGDQKPRLKDFLKDTYWGISQPYRLTITTGESRGPVKLEIGITGPGTEGVQASDVHYPREIQGCAAK